MSDPNEQLRRLAKRGASLRLKREPTAAELLLAAEHRREWNASWLGYLGAILGLVASGKSRSYGSGQGPIVAALGLGSFAAGVAISNDLEFRIRVLHEFAGGALVLILGLLLTALIWWSSYRLVCIYNRYALARERQWASSLPFRLDGYEAMLEREMACDLVITVRFESTPQDPELVLGAAKGVRWFQESVPTLSGEVLTVPQCFHLGQRHYSMPWGRVRLHELMDDLFLVLHATTKIQTISIALHH